MSLYFPSPEIVNLSSGVIIEKYNLGVMELGVSFLSPGAHLDKHFHTEFQFGMCLSNKFSMNVAGNEKTLTSLDVGYHILPDVVHSACNPFDEPAIGLDIKVKDPELLDKIGTSGFFGICKSLKLKTGIECTFLATSWVEVMISKIPTNAVMPVHSHEHEQIGVALVGAYSMTVGDETKIFDSHAVYYAPKNIAHGAINDFGDEAWSINVFSPPRYTKYIGRD